jgi:toxin secretion/phage lysis holin
MKAETIWSWIQICFTAVGGWLGWFLGGTDGFLYALVAFVVMDYMTGVLCAILDRKLSSEIGAKGIFKKVLIFLLVGVGHILDEQILGGAASPGGGGVIRTAVVFFYLSNEGISILENAAHIGLPVPEKLKAVLEQLHNRSEKEDNK